ncbi:MAG: hypothetical protein KDA70_11630, partial [Planctomycetaceae bacterium]|nr:hypothetical protein [Planctomycetaceae bacterium]
MRLKSFLLLLVLTVSVTSHAAENTNIPTRPEAASQIPDAFFKYIEREEPAYKWEIHDSFSHEGVTAYPVELTSQTW